MLLACADVSAVVVRTTVLAVVVRTVLALGAVVVAIPVVIPMMA